MNNAQWLQKEADQWLAEELITSEQHQVILGRYEKSNTTNPVLLFFSIIGALLIGAGVILIFATNWWRISIPIKLMIAFVPLLAAQAICAYIAFYKYSSNAYREGGAVLLSLAFFAGVALVGQVFHTPSDTETYVLVCSVFTLPICYLLRSKAALTIFVAGALFGIQDWSLAVALLAAVLPYFHLEFRAKHSSQMQSYLLLLLSVLSIRVLMAVGDPFGMSLHLALICGVMLLQIDVLYRKLYANYFFTPAKLLGILVISATTFVCSLDFSADYQETAGYFVCLVAFVLDYIWMRWLKWYGPMTSDAFVLAALLLGIFASHAGIAASILMGVLGIGFIIWGSRTMRIAHLNTGMIWLMLLIAVRFFDSSQSLLIRGIVFILLGITFLAVNFIVSRKRKEQTR